MYENKGSNRNKPGGSKDERQGNNSKRNKIQFELNRKHSLYNRKNDSQK